MKEDLSYEELDSYRNDQMKMTNAWIGINLCFSLCLLLFLSVSNSVSVSLSVPPLCQSVYVGQGIYISVCQFLNERLGDCCTMAVTSILLIKYALILPWFIIAVSTCFCRQPKVHARGHMLMLSIICNMPDHQPLNTELVNITSWPYELLVLNGMVLIQHFFQVIPKYLCQKHHGS